ncbi:MAG: hypothetical protein KatS3mg082_2868 [Nitrospiraceae bacterium]|nr:MAG: hypothetical protein KatS3mg082_2868 [Nitrospiraceae bacterium]
MSSVWSKVTGLTIRGRSQVSLSSKSQANKHWNWDPNVRGAESDYPVDDSDSDVTALMYNGVGGGTVIYAAHWQRFSSFRLPRTYFGRRCR